MTAIHSEPIVRTLGDVFRAFAERAAAKADRRKTFADLFDRHDDHLLDDIGLRRRDTPSERRKGTREPWLSWVL